MGTLGPLLAFIPSLGMTVHRFLWFCPLNHWCCAMPDQLRIRLPPSVMLYREVALTWFARPRPGDIWWAGPSLSINSSRLLGLSSVPNRRTGMFCLWMIPTGTDLQATVCVELGLFVGSRMINLDYCAGNSMELNSCLHIWWSCKFIHFFWHRSNSVFLLLCSIWYLWNKK